MHVYVTTQPPHPLRQPFALPTSTLHPASVLSRSELRRIIAEMLG